MSAPVAGQFLDGNVTLARFDIRPPVLADPAEVRMASAVVPPAPAPAPAARTATPAPQRAVADVRTVAPPAPLQQPLVRRASLALADHAAPAPTRPEPARAQAPATRPRAEAAPVRTASAEPRTPPAPAAAPTRPRAEPARTRTASAEARPRPAAARARSSSLLDDSTLRDLGTAARAERGGGTSELMATLAAQLERPSPAGDQQQGLALTYHRLMLVMLLFVGVTIVIVGRLAMLQLFTDRSGAGRSSPIPCCPPRGDIVDRNGVAARPDDRRLVDRRPSGPDHRRPARARRSSSTR